MLPSTRRHSFSEALPPSTKKPLSSHLRRGSAPTTLLDVFTSLNIPTKKIFETSSHEKIICAFPKGQTPFGIDPKTSEQFTLPMPVPTAGNCAEDYDSSFGLKPEDVEKCLQLHRISKETLCKLRQSQAPLACSTSVE